MIKFTKNCSFIVLCSTVIAEIFVRDLILYFSYFRLKVRNLVAYENHARITVYATPSSLYESAPTLEYKIFTRTKISAITVVHLVLGSCSFFFFLQDFFSFFQQMHARTHTHTHYYSKIGCRRTHVFRGQARCSYLQAAFLPCTFLTTYIADINGQNLTNTWMFLVQAGTFLCF